MLSAAGGGLMLVPEVRAGGRPGEELRSPAEGLSDRVTGEPSLVRAVPRALPRLSAGRKRAQRRLRYRLPGPCRAAVPVTTGAACHQADKVRGIEVQAHLVAHEPQPGQGA